MISLEPKRANEVRDYTHDWVPFLGADTIASQTTVGSGVTINSSNILTGNQSIKFWVAAGTSGTTGRITQTIVTAAGRTETEIFTLQVLVADEPISLADAKIYLRVTSTDEDAKIEAMIPRARKWVEDHTGLALVRRSFVERLLPTYGAIRLGKGPLVTVDEIAYVDALGADQVYVPRYWAGQETIFPAANESWPTLGTGEAFAVTYTAGYAEGEADDRLLGAMFALIESEYDSGYAYPPQATEAAERCCAYLRQMVA